MPRSYAKKGLIRSQLGGKAEFMIDKLALVNTQQRWGEKSLFANFIVFSHHQKALHWPEPGKPGIRCRAHHRIVHA